MGCVVNAIGEAKHADVAIAFGKGQGLVMRKGKIVEKLKEEFLVDRFLQEVDIAVKELE
jgi:(E)-4-hydroxy-3-methylbut-2-enyl-diphosphate synthase